MTTDVTQTAAAATVGAVGALSAGLPPPGVIACAVAGAVVHVWFMHSRADFVFNVRWCTVCAGLVMAYSAFGILGSTFIVSIGQAPIVAGQAPDGALVGMVRDVFRLLALVPMWALAGSLSISAGALLPLMKGWLSRKVKSDDIGGRPGGAG